MPKYVVHSREEANKVFDELKMKRHGWLPSGLAIAFADEAKRGKINPAHLTRLGHLMEALHKANRHDAFTEALHGTKTLIGSKGAKHAIAHLIKTLERHVEPSVKSKPTSGAKGLERNFLTTPITLKGVGRALTTPIPLGKVLRTPIPLGKRLGKVDKFLHTSVSLKGIRRTLNAPISFRSKGKMPSAKEVAAAKQKFDELKVPRHGILARNPALYVALHEGHKHGLLYDNELVGLGANLRDLFAGKNEQQKADLFKKLDGVFRKAEGHARKTGPFVAFSYLTDRTYDEKALNQTFADKVKRRVKYELLKPRHFR